MYRSPNKHFGSTPDIHTNQEETSSPNVPQRKRKHIDGWDLDLTEFKTEITSMFADIKSELKSLHLDNFKTHKSISEVKTQQQEMLAEFNDLKKSVEFVTEKQCDQEIQLAELTSKLSDLEKKQSDYETLNQKFEQQALELDRLQQYARIQNLEITGVPESKNEHLPNIIICIAKHAGIELTPNDIEHVNRVRPMTPREGRPRAIIVKLKNRAHKNSILAGLRRTRGVNTTDIGLQGETRKLYVNEHLIPSRKLVLKECKAAANDRGYEFVWVRECNIYAKKADGAPVLQLETLKDVKKIIYCHGVTFFLMFGYLFFFRLADKFGLPLSSGQTNLIEMIIVLRVVGVAFEINGSWLAMKKAKKNQEEKTDVAKKDADKDDEFLELIDPSLEDLFHYTFNYIGLLTGPYYRYRTFDDYFHLPFSSYVDCSAPTLKTIRMVPLYVMLYVALSNIWPLEYILSEEHNNRHFIYRMMYPWALFTAFRLRIYSGMTLATSACTAAGMGAYPVEGKNRTGHGPTVGYLKLKQMTAAEASKAKYDFNTVESMDVWGCETVVTLRDSMKVWNKAVQYWVAMVVYKRFPIKPLKIHAALFVSVIWHGFHAGYFFCIYACPFYLMAEDIYYKLYYKEATGLKKKIVGFVMWFLRVHSESYQAAAFLLLSFDRVWAYYSSMYHYWYGVWLVFLVSGFVLNQLHKSHSPKKVQGKIENISAEKVE